MRTLRRIASIPFVILAVVGVVVLAIGFVGAEVCDPTSPAHSIREILARLFGRDDSSLEGQYRAARAECDRPARDAGSRWRCTRAHGHDGPCAVVPRAPRQL